MVVLSTRREDDLVSDLHAGRHLAATRGGAFGRHHFEVHRVDLEHFETPVDIVVVAEAQGGCVLAVSLKRVKDDLGRARLEDRLVERHDRVHIVCEL